MSNTHETVRVRSPWGHVNIDRALAPLLRAIWRLGIETAGCCENAGQTNYNAEYHLYDACIAFSSHEDACRWLVVVREHVPSYGKTWTVSGEPWWRKDGTLNVGATVYFPSVQLGDLERATRRAARGRTMPSGEKNKLRPGSGPLEREWWELHGRPHDEAFRAKFEAMNKRLAANEVAAEERKRKRNGRATKRRRRAT